MTYIVIEPQCVYILMEQQCAYMLIERQCLIFSRSISVFIF